MLRYTNTKIVSLQDWDELVQKTYGRPYAFQQQYGCRSRGTYTINVPEKYPDDYENDTIPEVVNGDEMGVSFKAWLARDPKQELKGRDLKTFGSGIDIFWERNFYPEISMLANDLHTKGLIEVGSYTINIDW